MLPLLNTTYWHAPEEAHLHDVQDPCFSALSDAPLHSIKSFISSAHAVGIQFGAF